MARFSQWIAGARPRTLPAALAPVAAGTGAAAALHRAQGLRAGLALLVALALQVGVNYANDYSDGIRGTDAHRVGPFRLTGSGAAAPAAVRRAAWTGFALAGMAGCALVALCGAWWLLGVGALSVLAAWYYTGGRRPYGYAGLGELAVFLFFGLVAVLGTTYTQAGRVSGPALAAAVGVGALASAILVANNLRDIPTDAASGKRTLAVQLGDGRTRRLYFWLLLVPWLVLLPLLPSHPSLAWALLAVPLAWRPLRAVRARAQGLALLPVLQDTGRLDLVYGALLGLALAGLGGVAK
jgi:1,4-dihydroxy-2-naphthoate octaprenyltransferase